MSDTHVEKTFLYLVALSILLHAAIFAVIVSLPQERKRPGQEPYMVDLQDMPAVREQPVAKEKEVRRLAEQKRRVPREIAPKGDAERYRAPLIHPAAPAPVAPASPQQQPASQQPEPRAPLPALPREHGEAPVGEARRGSDFFKPKKGAGVPDVAKLFPSSDKLAKLEDGYRKKYGPEVEEGEARFLNADDLQFGSFLRRFESAVYGVWRYPAEAARLGIEGVTPVRITFNRNGEIERVDILESSGSRILDDEVRRTLKLVGPIGGFPKGYDKENFNLIAFFHYSIVRGRITGTLR